MPTDVILPADYLQFLRTQNGGEGTLEDGYIILWKSEELIPFNLKYEVKQHAPGVFLFGSNGGGEGYGFDSLAEMKVVQVPFVGMDRRHIEVLAPTFTDFFRTGRVSEVRDDTADPSRRSGMEIFEIQPIILGGDPVDPENKIWLTRDQHFEIVRYWNRVIRTQLLE